MSLTKLYTALKDTLVSLKHPTKDDTPAFNRVDLFNNQTEKKDLYLNAAVAEKLPAAFIQIKESEFMHLKNNVQRRTLRFCLHISSLIYDDEGKSTDEKVMELFDLLEAVHCEINGAFVEDDLGKVIFTPFVRTEDKQFIDDDKGEDASDTAFDPVHTHIITYETVQTVITARKPQNQVNIKRILISDVAIDPNDMEIAGDESSLDETDLENYRLIETENTKPNIIVTPVDFPTSE